MRWERGGQGGGRHRQRQKEAERWGETDREMGAERQREAGRRGSEEHGQREADGHHGDIGPGEVTVRDTELHTEKGQGH